MQAAAGLVVASVLLLVGVSLHAAVRTRTAAWALMDDGPASARAAIQIDLLLMQQRNVVRHLSNEADPARRATAALALQAVDDGLQAAVSPTPGSRPAHPSLQPLLQALRPGLSDLLAATTALIDPMLHGDPVAAGSMIRERHASIIDGMQRAVGLWQRARSARLHAQIEEVLACAWLLVTRVLFCAAVVVLIVVMATVAMRRGLGRLDRLRHAMLRLAANDTTVEIEPHPDADEIGALARAVQRFKDTTIEVAAQDAALRVASGRLEAALDNMSQGLCLYDGESRLQVVNRRFFELFGIDPACVQPGVRFRDVVQASIDSGNHPDCDVDAVVAARRACLARERSMLAHQDLGNGRMIAISHTRLDDGGWVATYEDVTARQAAEARIAHLARHDPVSGLPNLVRVTEALDGTLDEVLTQPGRQAALMSIDLDDFKALNETLGHQAGDALLRAVAGRMQQLVGNAGLVGRVVSDEFAVVQQAIDRPEDATELATRLVAGLAEPFVIDGREITTGGSVGIALIPGDGAESATVLRYAAAALARAKADGRGTVRLFERGIDARLQARRQLELDLRAALAGEQFELFYQPLIDLRRGGVCGFEALIRWWHPERGLVMPGEFVPVLEETGLIVPVGEWVLRRACQDAAAWPTTATGGLSLAVNLSPAQLGSPHLVGAVARALSASGLAADRLELEITESVLLERNEGTLDLLRRLRAMGLHVAIDDFGTGYSSLATLRSFPFDRLKIDRSFVADLTERADAVHVIRAICGLCAGLGMTVTAEGVENRAQLETLRDEGCTEMQGYLFSQPRPADQVGAIIESVRCRLEHTTAVRDHEGLQVETT